MGNQLLYWFSAYRKILYLEGIPLNAELMQKMPSKDFVLDLVCFYWIDIDKCVNIYLYLHKCPPVLVFEAYSLDCNLLIFTSWDLHSHSF